MARAWGCACSPAKRANPTVAIPRWDSGWCAKVRAPTGDDCLTVSSLLEMTVERWNGEMVSAFLVMFYGLSILLSYYKKSPRFKPGLWTHIILYLYIHLNHNEMSVFQVFLSVE